MRPTACRLSSDWESTRLKIELSPVQIREAAFLLRAIARAAEMESDRDLNQGAGGERSERERPWFTIREAALDSDFTCLRCCAGDFPGFLRTDLATASCDCGCTSFIQLLLPRGSGIRTPVRTQVHEWPLDLWCRSEYTKILAYSRSVAVESSPTGRPCSHSTARTASGSESSLRSTTASGCESMNSAGSCATGVEPSFT